jgi:hypothetical protein
VPEWLEAAEAEDAPRGDDPEDADDPEEDAPGPEEGADPDPPPEGLPRSRLPENCTPSPAVPKLP